MIYLSVNNDLLTRNIHLNAVRLDELYCLVKKDGYTKIYKASENATICELYEAGDLLGELWRQGLLLEEVMG